MEDILYKSMLYDYYNPLLTEKQREVYEMYNHSDMSLSEIADITSVTPQGVSDMLKRCDKSLLGYEQRLGLVANRQRLKEKFDELLDLVSKVSKNQGETEKIKLLTEEIIDLA